LAGPLLRDFRPQDDLEPGVDLGHRPAAAGAADGAQRRPHRRGPPCPQRRRPRPRARRPGGPARSERVGRACVACARQREGTTGGALRRRGLRAGVRRCRRRGA
jgi:hypothetical protein